MLDTSPDALNTLIGELPDGDVPAAWWVTNDLARLAEYVAYRTAYDTWFASAKALARDAGGDPEGIRVRRGFGDRRLGGFLPLPGTDPAPGWRLDTKTRVIVPSRRTKADRESSAAKQFEALSVVPTAGRHVTGMPTGLFLPGVWHPVQILRSGSALLAFCSGDPDRADPQDRREFIVGDTWTRIPLSTFHQLRERQAGAA